MCIRDRPGGDDPAAVLVVSVFHGRARVHGTMEIAMTDTIIDKDVAMDAMGQFQVDDNSDIPIWIQIRKRLVYLIRSGKLDENERLPSVRELSVQLGVNYNTINKVYQDLERDGFIFTRRGKGSYVAERTADEALDIDDEVEALATDLVGRAFEKGMDCLLYTSPRVAARGIIQVALALFSKELRVEELGKRHACLLYTSRCV